jgi:hypothetical protein
MQAEHSSEMSVSTYNHTYCQNPEGCHVTLTHYASLKTYITKFFLAISVRYILVKSQLMKWDLSLCGIGFTDNGEREEELDSDVAAEKSKLLKTDTSVLLKEYELVLK